MHLHFYIVFLKTSLCTFCILGDFSSETHIVYFSYAHTHEGFIFASPHLPPKKILEHSLIASFSSNGKNAQNNGCEDEASFME